jgi:hypothetical protein
MKYLLLVFLLGCVHPKPPQEVTLDLPEPKQIGSNKALPPVKHFMSSQEILVDLAKFNYEWKKVAADIELSAVFTKSDYEWINSCIETILNQTTTRVENGAITYEDFLDRMKLMGKFMELGLRMMKEQEAVRVEIRALREEFFELQKKSP